MGFGISYEMIITVFVVLVGILFIVLGYTPLAVPLIQISFLLGFFIMLLGFFSRDYDQMYTGVLLMIIPLVLISSLVSVGISQDTLEGGLFYAIAPIITFFHWLYSTHPIVFVLFIIVLAYAFSKK